MLSALAPVLIDRLRPVGLRAYPPACKPCGLYGLEAAPEGGLDCNDIVSGDGPFSDGPGPLSELYAPQELYEQEAGS